MSLMRFDVQKAFLFISGIIVANSKDLNLSLESGVAGRVAVADLRTAEVDSKQMKNLKTYNSKPEFFVEAGETESDFGLSELLGFVLSGGFSFLSRSCCFSSIDFSFGGGWKQNRSAKGSSFFPAVLELALNVLDWLAGRDMEAPSP